MPIPMNGLEIGALSLALVLSVLFPAYGYGFFLPAVCLAVLRFVGPGRVHTLPGALRFLGLSVAVIAVTYGMYRAAFILGDHLTG